MRKAVDHSTLIDDEASSMVPEGANTPDNAAADAANSYRRDELKNSERVDVRDIFSFENIGKTIA